MHIIIIEGNPEGYPEQLKAFYDKLQAFLQDLGYTVTRDPGLPHTEPLPADVWIGHSRGVDRLRFAPKSQRTISMGCREGISDKWDLHCERLREEYKALHNLHWPDVPFEERARLKSMCLDSAVQKYGPWPEGEIPHLMLTDDMKEQLRQALAIDHTTTFEINDVSMKWKVPELWKLARDLPTKTVTLDFLTETNNKLTWGKLNKTTLAAHIQRINHADLSYPIITTQDGIILDGAHRLVHAILNNIKELQIIPIPNNLLLP